MQQVLKVGQPWPGAVPSQAGAHLELRADGLTLMIQFPGLKRSELRAFTKSFRRYAFLETSTPVPIAVWVFEFPKPFGAVDSNFNSRLIRSEWLDDYLDTTDGIKNRLVIHLLDGNILRGNKLVGLDPVAVDLFHDTIRKQRDSDYNQGEYTRYLAGIYQYDWKELMRMAVCLNIDEAVRLGPEMRNDKRKLIDEMADVKIRMNDLAGTMRSFAKITTDEQDYLNTHADELSSAARMIDDWIDNLMIDPG